MGRSKELYILGLVLFIAAFLRFYNLMHDSPYFFDPDERNMAIAISQFRLPEKLTDVPKCLLSEFFPQTPYSNTYNQEPNSCNLNPHFFAYGQFPLYLAFLSDQTTKLIPEKVRNIPLFFNSVNMQRSEPSNYRSTIFPSAIFWLRFWSALSSTLTVLLVFLISSQFLTFNFAFLTSVLTAFIPGLIQAAHFGTTESLLTFFFTTSIYLSIRLTKTSLKKSLKKDLLSNTKYLIFLSLIIGLSLGTKFTGLFFFVPPFFALMIQIIRVIKRRRKNRVIGLLAYFTIGLLMFVGSMLIFLASSPYNLIEFQNFKSAVFGYEADVATGRFPAFYTRQFINTTPILFQVEKIFPYALGWPIFIFGTLGFLFVSIQLIEQTFLSIIYHISSKLQLKIQNYRNSKASPKETILESEFNAKTTDMAKPSYLAQKERSQDKRRASEKFVFEGVLIIILCSFLIYFFPNAFIFAKWTRFMTPIFPFFVIFAGYFLYQLFHHQKVLHFFVKPYSHLGWWRGNDLDSSEVKEIADSFHRPRSPYGHLGDDKSAKLYLLMVIIIVIVIIVSILPGIAFMSIYSHPDSRITASEWIWNNIPDKSYILFETANVIDIPLGIPNRNLPQKTYELISFDFYHIDENKDLFDNLLVHLEKADYFFIPSRRIFTNHLRFPQKFPLLTKYYQLLFSGALGFEKVVEFSSFPRLKIGPLDYSFNDELAEETFTVFDHPVIRIYRKVKPMTKDEYRSLFKSNTIDEVLSSYSKKGIDFEEIGMIDYL